MQKTSSRQLAMILSLSIISLKFLIFPAFISKYALNNAYISVIIGCVVDLVFILVFAYILTKCPNMTFSELISKTFGKVFAKILLIILFFFFMIKGVVTIKELHNYFLEFLFDELAWINYVVPLFFLLIYVCYKGIKCFSRMVEFIFFIVLIGTVATIILPIMKIDFSNLLPFLNKGISPVIDGLFHSSFGWGDFMIIIIFMGKVKVDKYSFKRIAKYAIWTELFVVLFFVTFSASFGFTGLSQVAAISDVPMYALSPNHIGNLQWISIILWSITLLIQASLMLLASTKCLVDIVPKINRKLAVGIVCVITLIFIIFFYLSLAKLIKLLINNIFVWSYLGFETTIIVVTSIAFCVQTKHNKNNKVVQYENKHKKVV